MEKNLKSFKRQIILLVIFGLILGITLNIDFVLAKIAVLFSVMTPIVIGCLTAFILNIIVNLFEEKIFNKINNKIMEKIKRPISILLAFLSIALLTYILINIIVPQVSKSLSIFINQLPHLFDVGKKQVEEYTGLYPDLQKQMQNGDFNTQEIIQKIVNTITTWAGGILSILNSIFGVITNLVIALILAIYIVNSKEKLQRQFDKLFKKLLTNKANRKLYYILNLSNETFRSFFIGQFIEAIILGCLCTAGMYIFKFPYPPMIGSVIGVTALIPMVGAYLGCLFGFLMILPVNPFMAFAFILFIIVLQQLEGNIIYPKVVGSSVGLPGLWVLIAIIIGGGLFGVVGILLGVPIMATIYRITKDIVNDNAPELFDDKIKTKTDIKIERDVTSAPTDNTSKIEITNEK